MAITNILGFCLFAFATSVTPGPNNLMLLASGVNFGTRASIPHILGISSGFFIMLVAVGVGLSAMFNYYPVTYTVMKFVCSAYLLYLAWGIATAHSPKKHEVAQPTRPMTWKGAALFQWVNPKAWIMAIGAFGTYAIPKPGISLTLGIGVLFAIINAPSVALWAVMGSKLRRLIEKPKYRRWFNIGSALLLALSLVPIIFDGL